ncbi:CDP-alcohol phosphatidyltransferase family protein [uncultured Alsobacter sp.]|uniref:CDP-alcohol phosphatidyltransferase family protein n=1 Tax=uncultured Alsobacter sp. TaxID=1748258 RepID=UPI0025E80089|nr:CDP-alcohol phosphatidyltransferase family protein [uncultured Alsobacter sp.]
MLDGIARKLVDPALDALADRLARTGIGANSITLAAFLAGIGCAAAIGARWDLAALLLLAASRLCDGLDGALARRTATTDRGGYADIVGDFVFYGAVPFAFAWRAPEVNALPAAFLLLTFYVNGASFLAYAAIAAKRGLTTAPRGPKAIHYTAGLAEGTETILAFAAMILWPSAFPLVAWVFGLACVVTALSRVALAWRDFADPPR